MPEQDVAAELAGLRLSIDNIDAALVHMLAERFKFTQQVGRLKAASGMPPSDPERERMQIARLRALAEEAQLDPAFAEKWFNFVVAEVIHHHEQIATDDHHGPSHPPRTPAVTLGSPAPAVAGRADDRRHRRQRRHRLFHGASSSPGRAPG